MTHFIAPTDVTKEQSENNNSAVEKVENNENDSQQQITHNYSTSVGSVFGIVTFMINRIQCALLFKFSFH